MGKFEEFADILEKLLLKLLFSSFLQIWKKNFFLITIFFITSNNLEEAFMGAILTKGTWFPVIITGVRITWNEPSFL